MSLFIYRRHGPYLSGRGARGRTSLKIYERDSEHECVCKSAHRHSNIRALPAPETDSGFSKDATEATEGRTLVIFIVLFICYMFPFGLSREFLTFRPMNAGTPPIRPARGTSSGTGK